MNPYLVVGLSLVALGSALGVFALVEYRKQNYRPRRVRSTWID